MSEKRTQPQGAKRWHNRSDKARRRRRRDSRRSRWLHHLARIHATIEAALYGQYLTGNAYINTRTLKVTF